MNVLIGFFTVAGVGPVSVETELSGESRLDHAKLWKLVRDKYPKATEKDIVRVGSSIEPRSDEPLVVKYPVGAVAKNLFDGAGTDECSLLVGTVVFNLESCNLFLHYHRSKNSLSVSLKERSSGVTIRVGGIIPAMKLVREVPALVKDILGQDAKELKLALVEGV